jgi:hypothetical protein
MNIINEQIKKSEQVFALLGYQKDESQVRMHELENLIMMDIAAEALAMYGKKDGMEFEKEDVGKFLAANFSQDQIKEVTEIVVADVVSEYFMKILKDIEDDELKRKAEEILA